jgi:hypothetical protein
MPRTPNISLHSVHAVLAPDKADTEVATSIIFARLVDFIRYMEDDPFDLLFNRNVRVAISLSQSAVNQEIRDTFKDNPKEFAFSNNGITMLCEKQHCDPGQKVLTLENPRVVNGSQTLHSIRDVPNPSPNARVMVRIIEIEPPCGDALDEKYQWRKEIINKIARRSNRQNPIKAWDLAANDDFQLELFRFFRNKGFFYERRKGEWQQRRKQLKNVNIQYGGNIRRLSQLIASYHWSKPKLGPAVAKRVAELFDGEIYDTISATSPELAYQIMLINRNLRECERDLASQKVYIARLKAYGQFVIFTLAIKALRDAGAKFGDPSFTDQLESQWQEWPSYYIEWKRLTKACTDHMLKAFKKESARAARGGDALTYVNYVKNQGYLSQLLGARLSGVIKRHARAVLKT